MYKTTSRHLDSIRDYFTFDLENVLSYRVGSCSIVGGGDNVDNNLSSNVYIVPSDEYKQMESNLLKMQHMLLICKDRLDTLELLVSSMFLYHYYFVIILYIYFTFVETKQEPTDKQNNNNNSELFHSNGTNIHDDDNSDNVTITTTINNKRKKVR